MTHVQPGDRIAVIGATGFVGQVVVEELAAQGYHIVGVSERSEPPSRITNVLADYRSTDLTSSAPAISDCAGLVHLAGLAAVGPSFERPQEYITTNSAMVTNLFEQALAEGWQGRALVVSSGAVYGPTDGSAGFSEESTPIATSPYVVSKLLVENQTEYYRRRGIDAIVARPFNHIGRGQHAGFIVPDLTEKVAQWHQGAELAVGNLASARDYTDVSDVVRAYQALLELPTPRHSVYNVCSGTARSGWEILEAVCRAMRVPVPPTTTTNPRAIDPSVIKGNAERLMRETDWQPKIDLDTSVAAFVDSYLARECP